MMDIGLYLDAGIPLVAGFIWTIRGFRRSGAQERGFLQRWRWVGPVFLAFALSRFDAAIGATKEPSVPTDAREVAVALRKKLAPPAMIDAVTRLDAIESVGRYVVFQQTVVSPPATEGEREALVEQVSRRARTATCGDKGSRHWLRKDLGFQWEITMAGRRYPSIAVREKDCE
jgi:hypothetical protein